MLIFDDALRSRLTEALAIAASAEGLDEAVAEEHRIAVALWTYAGGSTLPDDLSLREHIIAQVDGASFMLRFPVPLPSPERVLLRPWVPAEAHLLSDFYKWYTEWRLLSSEHAVARQRLVPVVRRIQDTSELAALNPGFPAIAETLLRRHLH